jgi:tetratricopeptide (TPR) repeat protein
MISRPDSKRLAVAEYLGKKGMEYYNRGAYDKAAVLFERLLEERPECVKSRTFYGLSLFWQRKFDRAIEALEECLAQNIIFQELPLYIAFSYYALGNCQVSVSLCENFVLGGHASEECKNCALVICDCCKNKPQQRKRKKTVEIPEIFNDMFDSMLMKERREMRYF